MGGSQKTTNAEFDWICVVLLCSYQVQLQWLLWYPGATG